MSPLCGWNMAPRIISPHRNIPVIASISRTPRPVRLSSRWPPPGISQARPTAGAQTPNGAVGCFGSFSFAIWILLSLALAGWAG